MGAVVCATRGGEGSRAAQSLAIRRAKEANAPLAFLFIADRQLAAEFHGNLADAFEQELMWLGRVLLYIAKERAARAGIEARVHISLGAVREEIVRFVTREEANLLVLGAPRGTTPAFGDDAIDRFAAEIEKQAHIRVEIARPEDA